VQIHLLLSCTTMLPADLSSTSTLETETTDLGGLHAAGEAEEMYCDCEDSFLCVVDVNETDSGEAQCSASESGEVHVSDGGGQVNKRMKKKGKGKGYKAISASEGS